MRRHQLAPRWLAQRGSRVDRRRTPPSAPEHADVFELEDRIDHERAGLLPVGRGVYAARKSIQTLTAGEPAAQTTSAAIADATAAARSARWSSSLRYLP